MALPPCHTLQKRNTNSKVRALSRIRLPKQVCFQVFCKSIQTRRGGPQIIWQNIPTARTTGPATAKDLKA